MSRRSAVAVLPAELARGAVTWRTFVSPDERPAYAGLDEDLDWWRRIRAWRRWEAAVEQWGVEHDLDRKDLMARGWWPSSPRALAP